MRWSSCTSPELSPSILSNLSLVADQAVLAAATLRSAARPRSSLPSLSSVRTLRTRNRGQSSEANSIDILTTLFPLHIGPTYWTGQADDSHNILLTIYRYSILT